MLTDSITLLVGATVRASIVLGAAWVLAAALRRASASTRHLLWTCAIAGAALVPLTAIAAPPRWQVPAPTAFAWLTTAIAPAPAPVATPGTRTQIATSPDSQREMPGSTPPDSRRADASSYYRPNAAPAAVVVWAAGMLAILLYLAVGAAAAWWIRRSATRIDAAWLAEAHLLAEALEIPGPVTFVESTTVTMPMVSGLWRPLIFMPAGAAEWPEARLRVVVLHELAHVKRRDCLTQALAQVVCAAYWFNPLAWIAARRLRAERERACDDFVLAVGTKGSEYAGHLLEIASAMQNARFSPAAAVSLAMARPSQLEGRLMAILDPAVRRSSALHTRLATVAALLLISIPVAAVQLASPRPATRTVPPATAPALQSLSAPGTAASLNRAGENNQLQGPGPNPAARPRPAQTTRGEFERRALAGSLIELAGDGDLDGIAALLDVGVDVNGVVRGDGSPLIAAAGDGHVDAVTLLLDRGADPNIGVAGDGSPLIAAASDGHTGTVRLLLERGANPNLAVEGDGSPLIAAAADGHVDVVKLLLERGADINLAVPGDGSPLIAAAEDGHVAVVELLLDRGADINQIVEGDETALIGASADGHLDVVKLLVERGADVHLRVLVDLYDYTSIDPRQRPRARYVGQEWRSALSVARRERHTAVVQYLLSAGARD